MLLVILLPPACSRRKEPEGTAVDLPGAPAEPPSRKAQVAAARERADMAVEVMEEGPPMVVDGAIIAALMVVPRHRFVLPEARRRAYFNEPVPVGRGQVSSKPYLVALMARLLALDGDERVLEVGAGTGYQAAVLSHLARQVVAVEADPVLAGRARHLLAEVAAAPVRVVTADGRRGWPPGAPYDAICVTGGLPELPEAMTGQLVEGGRLVAPVGPAGRQHLVQVVKGPEGLETNRIMRVRYGMLQGGPSDAR